MITGLTARHACNCLRLLASHSDLRLHTSHHLQQTLSFFSCWKHHLIERCRRKSRAIWELLGQGIVLQICVYSMIDALRVGVKRCYASWCWELVWEYLLGVTIKSYYGNWCWELLWELLMRVTMRVAAESYYEKCYESYSESCYESCYETCYDKLCWELLLRVVMIVTLRVDFESCQNYCELILRVTMRVAMRVHVESCFEMIMRVTMRGVHAVCM